MSGLDLRDFQRAQRQWIDAGLGELARRDDRWSEAIAVGSLTFVEKVKNDLCVKGMHREVLEADGTYAVRESAEAYAGNFTDKNEALRSANTILWNENLGNAGTSPGPSGEQPQVRQ